MNPMALAAREASGPAEMVWYYKENTPLPEELAASEVGNVAAFLCSPLASGITGTTVYVDKGYHTLGRMVGG